VARKGERDSLKSGRIGQSAAKDILPLEFLQLATHELALFGVRFGVRFASTRGYRIIEAKTPFGLLLLAAQVGENRSDQVCCNAAPPIDRIGGATRRELSHSEVLACGFADEIDGVFIAHGHGGHGSILESDRAPFSSKSLDVEASFSIHQSGDVCCCHGVHSIPRRTGRMSTFNDHPERE
jgi:hypothetical protein